MKYTDIEVEHGPICVRFKCINCSEEIEMNYDEFIDKVGADFHEDWHKIECDNCEYTNTIGKVDMV